MRSYSSSSTVSAAKIIAVQRSSFAPTSTFLLVYETPEAGVGTSANVIETSDWMTANGAEVGGYLVDKGAGIYGFLSAAAFEAVYTLVTP